MRDFFRSILGREPLRSEDERPSRAPSIPSLAAGARRDWEPLLPRVLEAIVVLDRAAPDAAAEKMVVRMLRRPVEQGVHALSWLDARPRGDVLLAGPTNRVRKVRRLAVRQQPIEVGDPAALPPELEKAVAAFTAASESVVEVTPDGRRVAAEQGALSPENRERATIALFVAWTRALLETLDQVALAAQGSDRVHLALASVQSALRNASVVEFDPRRGEPVDLAETRIVGHEPGRPDEVVRVARSGVRWRGQVLRKAEVVIGTADPATPSPR
jgi:hypothetical protein